MTDKQRPGGNAPAATASTSLPIDAIQEAVKSVRFGVVQLIIQDGKVVQIDKTEKIRLA